MAAIPLSLLAAVCWGSADFIGGIVSRRNAIPGVMLTVLGVGLAAALTFVIVASEPVPAQAVVPHASSAADGSHPPRTASRTGAPVGHARTVYCPLHGGVKE